MSEADPGTPSPNPFPTAVLGPGGVGGTLAARLAQAGVSVTCVARRATAEAIRRNGLVLDLPGNNTVTARLEACERLTRPVALLIIATKAGGLVPALERVDPGAVRDAVVLPLLNGLEHMDVLRARWGGRVAAGSIRIEAFSRSPGHVVQASPFAVVRMAAEREPAQGRLGRVVAVLRAAGIEAHVAASEKGVLWDKLARLAPLACATALARSPVGALRADPAWRSRLDRALHETCAVAAADGAPQSSDDHWRVIDAMPASLTTSLARDLDTGRPSELDAIVGAVVRAARRLDIPCPGMKEWLDRLAPGAENPRCPPPLP
jgi:2-dehydropantoate 2-reductase